MAPLLKVFRLLLSDRGVLVAQRGLKKWMADHSGGTDLDSGTESQRGTETGIETGIERGTEVLAVGGVHLVMEGGEEAVIEWMGGTGLEVGRTMKAITGEEDGREIETEIGTETATRTGTATQTETAIGTETAIRTETAIGTETDGTGGRDEAAWIATGNE